MIIEIKKVFTLLTTVQSAVLIQQSKFFYCCAQKMQLNCLVALTMPCPQVLVRIGEKELLVQQEKVICYFLY